jgi:hypothetical protein
MVTLPGIVTARGVFSVKLGEFTEMVAVDHHGRVIKRISVLTELRRDSDGATLWEFLDSADPESASAPRSAPMRCLQLVGSEQIRQVRKSTTPRKGVADSAIDEKNMTPR